MKNYNYFLTRIFLLVIFSLIVSNVSAYDPTRVIRPCPTGTTDPLPEGWAFRDVGNITPATDWCYNATKGQYYLKAYGNETYGSSPDQCGFLYFQTDEDRQVSVRIMDAEVVLNTAAKGFIMIRGGLAEDDPMAYIEVKTQNNNQICFCWRLEKASANGSASGECIQSGTIGSTFNPPNCYPRWIKFIRQGLYITAFHKDDVEGASWIKIKSVKKLLLKGKAYMGIGSCSVLNSGAYNGDRTKPGIFIFDNLAVEEIDVPYELLYPEAVETSFAENVKPGKQKDIDITSVFGHALGEYFTIGVESVDPSIAEVYFWEKKVENATDGEDFRKFVHIKGLREGVTSVKMTCTINGYTMTTDYALNVSDGKSKPKTANTSAPYGWDLVNMIVPVDPNLVYGQEFVTRNLSISKKFPVFIGSWEYDWGGVGVGNYSRLPGNSSPTTNTSSEMYIAGAEMYSFRDERVKYTKTAGYAKDTIRSENGGSFIDLAFVPKNSPADSSSYTSGKQDLLFSVSKDANGAVVWNECKGFWTQRINYTDRTTGLPVRGLPYITNIQAGDWVTYTVYAPRSGYYIISPIAACKNPNKSLRVDVNGIMQVSELAITKGSNGSDWKKGGSELILLAQGKNQLKFVANAADFNLLGFKILFKLPSKEPYSGLAYDENKYFQPDEKIDTTLMAEDELVTYDSIKRIYPASSEEDKLIMDSVLLNYPKIKEYNTDTIISRYRSQLESMQIPFATEQEKSAALDTIKKKLTNSIDSVSFVTTQQTNMKHIDVTSYLFKRGYDPKKPIEISMKIDSIANAGRGTYMGIMLRTLLEDKVAPNSPCVSYGIGSYEGGRLSYRWGYNYDYKKMDNENIAQDVYLKIRLNYYAPDYLTAYYSYDNLFWWEFLADPLKISFLSGTGVDDNIAIGLYLTGGTFASDACLALGNTRNFVIKQYDSVDEFENYYSQEEMNNLPLTMNPTTVAKGTSVEISYNVVKPGQVSMKVYDVYGVLKETVMDEYQSFNKDAVIKTHTFQNLTETGVYLLRLEGPNNEQYIRFRYTAE